MFGERGLQVPFSAIAKDAGVSQGVLYRHFPSLMDLAVAVFEESLDQIEEAMAQRPEGVSAFTVCWDEFVARTVSDSGFIETAVCSFRDPRFYVVWRRINHLLVGSAGEAREQGHLGEDVAVDTLFLGLRAVYGAVSTSGNPNAFTEYEVKTILEGLGLPVPEVIIRVPER